MPRKPKHLHPLRELRAATRFPSQKEFAAFLGISWPTVQAIENGKLRLSPKLAARIREATGASDRELLKGFVGKARTVSGEPYSVDFFDAWQRNRNQRAEEESRTQADAAHLAAWTRFLLDAARRSGSLEKVQAVRTLMLESLDAVREKLGLIHETNDLLTPYQVVTTQTAEFGAWRKDKSRQAQELGFDPGFPLKNRTKLTLSLQTSPSWCLTQPLPQSQTTNIDLLPPSYFVVAIGQTGCETAHRFWEALCREHGIDDHNGHALHGAPTGAWQGFFRQVRQENGSMRYVPRAVFADLDPEQISQLSKRSGELYHSGGLLSGEASSGNLFAANRDGPPGALLERIMDFVHRQTDDAGGPSGVFLFYSLEGGTGSGLGSLTLCQMRQEMPTLPLVTVNVLPHPKHSHVVTAPYNALLGLQIAQECATASILMENQEILDFAESAWKFSSPSLPEANALIAESLAAFTAPLRFASASHPPQDLRGYLAQILPEGQNGSARLTLQTLPLRFRLPGTTENFTAQQVLKNQAKAMRVKGRKTIESEHLGIFLKVREAEAGPLLLKSARSLPKFALTPYRRPGNQESITLLQDASRFSVILGEIRNQARQLLKRRAYLHWYSEAGIDEPALQAAVGTDAAEVG